MNNTIDKQLQRDVQARLGWSIQNYAQFIYDCGITYLAKYIPDCPQVATEISKSLVFWNWWKAHWEKRELQFIEQIYGLEENHEEMLELYKELHDPRSLAEGIYMNGEVLNETYAEMFGKLTKAQRKEVFA